MRTSRRLRTLAIATVLLLLPLGGCRPERDAPLEELPAAIAADLQTLPGTDALVAAARPTTATGDVAPGPLPVPRDCETTQEFFSYILYPVTFCSPIFEFGEVLTAYVEATTPPGSAPTGDRQSKTFQLSSFQGRRFDPRLTCHQRSGPWGATITKTQLCNGGISCVMAVPCPGCPTFLWDGDNCETTGRPTEVIFIPELTARLPSIKRCPGSISTCGEEEPDPTETPVIQ
jgi:hypothetical protein